MTPEGKQLKIDEALRRFLDSLQNSVHDEIERKEVEGEQWREAVRRLVMEIKPLLVGE